MTNMHQRLTVLILVLIAACGPRIDEPPGQTAQTNGATDDGPVCGDGPGEVFERRIAPLLEQDRPSSCSKCHAAGVNLAAFVTGDACSSMACLVERGMVDLEQPRQSLLLQFIERGYEPMPDTGVTDVMVARQYTGFLEWIEWSAQCPEQCPPPEGSTQCSAPDTPLIDDEEEEEEELPGYPPLNLENYPCTEDAQAEAFRDYVFPSQSRCGHCHAVDGALAGVGGAPTWIDHQRSVLGSKRTIRSLYALGNIDLEVPAKSLLLLKPLHEDAGGVEHGGGGKFRDRTDQLYVDTLQWIRMQAACSLTGQAPNPVLPPDKLRTRYSELPYVP